MILIYGGGGALGSTLIKTLKEKTKYETISVDIAENKEATKSIVINPKLSFEEQAKYIESELKEILKDQKLAHVINSAGGWAGGSISTSKIYENTEKMWQASVQTSIISANMASKFMDK